MALELRSAWTLDGWLPTISCRSILPWDIAIRLRGNGLGPRIAWTLHTRPPAISCRSILPWNIAIRLRENGLGAANRLDAGRVVAGYILSQYTTVGYSHPFTREWPWAANRLDSACVVAGYILRQYTAMGYSHALSRGWPWGAERMNFRRAPPLRSLSLWFPRSLSPTLIRERGFNGRAEPAARTRGSITDRGDGGRIRRRFAQTLAK